MFQALIKPLIFRATSSDPERAHGIMVRGFDLLWKLHLEKLVLDNRDNCRPSGCAVSNAAGFNKNGEIPPLILEYLGFERGVIGTLTADSWPGNPRPRTVRFVKSESLVNWAGLPGHGAENVAHRLGTQRLGKMPLTINLMSTPGKVGDAILRDLERTVLVTRDLKNVDRFELNVSCPNTFSARGSMDARRENEKETGRMIEAVSGNMRQGQELFLKVSPDMDEAGVEHIVEVAGRLAVRGITTTNTTTVHDPEFVFVSPGKGGASGNALYSKSLATQALFYQKLEEVNADLKIIACGGINSLPRVRERLAVGASEIQLYTPLIFSGTAFLRKLRRELRGS